LDFFTSVDYVTFMTFLQTLKEEVVERRGMPSSQMKSMPNKRQMKKNRPMSQWKAQRMGLPTNSDEEEEGKHYWNDGSYDAC
jgi:hypothetical protein